MVDSVTITAGGQSATLGRKTRKAIDKALTDRLADVGPGRLITNPGQDDERAWELGPGPAQSEQARKDPDALAYVPMVAGEFRDAPDIQAIAQRVIRKHHMNDIEKLPIVYHWKAKGGSKGGRITYGKCSKLSGIAQHYAGAPFQIWIAADWVRADEFTNFQLEALVHHELRHITTEEDDEGNVTYALRGHDLEVFLEDLELYGDWQRDIKAARPVFKQLEITGLEDDLRAAYGSAAE